jgi:hypothetical protein
MKTDKIILISIIGIFLFLLPAIVDAATINATSCSYADVNAAISAASAGDTVMVPAGSATWDSSLLITKGIYLIGAGIGNTIITNNSGGGVGWNDLYWIQYDPANYDLNTPFRLSGFTWDLNNSSRWLFLGPSPSKTAPFTIQNQIRVDHNRIINPAAGSAQFIWNSCHFYGVVDNNEMIGGTYFIKNDAQVSGSSWWSNAPQNIFVSGSNNYMYYEDNLFEIDVESESNPIGEAQYSGRYVFRYNTITGHHSYSLFEMHGHQTSGDMDSCFGAEVYGNQITTTGSGYTLFKTRGGRSFIHHNNITGSGTHNCYAYTGLVTCADYTPELQIINNNYWFNSRLNLTGSILSDSINPGLDCAGLTNIPTAGRDVITNSTTPGVTAGPLASLPETCVEHQGYWATDQSTTDLTGMVGKNPATPISGTLYKCTATNTWTLYYTPYTYPHPLRVEVVDTTPPAAPTGVVVN